MSRSRISCYYGAGLRDSQGTGTERDTGFQFLRDLVN